MKTLDRIKLEVFATEIWTEHEDLDEVIDEVAKRYAKEVAREALKNASEEATIRLDYEEYTSSDWIDKLTIIDESNIPEILKLTTCIMKLTKQHHQFVNLC